MKVLPNIIKLSPIDIFSLLIFSLPLVSLRVVTFHPHVFITLTDCLLLLAGMSLIVQLSKEKKLLYLPLSWIFLAYITILIISFFNSPSFLKCIQGLKGAVTPILMFYIAYNIIKTEEDFKQICYVLIFIGIISAIAATIQHIYFFQAEELEKVMDISSADVRSAYVWKYPSLFGAFFVLIIPISIVVFEEKSLLYKAILCFGLVIMYVSVFFTFTRSSITAVAIVSLMMLFLRRVSIATLVMLIFVSLVILASFREEFKLLLTRFGDIRDPCSVNYASLHLRYEYWRAALDVFKNHPIIGGGIQTFPLYVPWRANDAHNFILQTLAEIGILGLAVRIIIYGVFFYNEWRLWNILKDLFLRKIIQAFLFGFIVAFIQAQVDNHLISERFLLVFWLLRGMAWKLANISLNH